jgi:glycosyltransferase involved in cell wall biosynthesis
MLKENPDAMQASTCPSLAPPRIQPALVEWRGLADAKPPHPNTPSSTSEDADTTCTNRVAVILGYYNGQTWLAEQLRSIMNQTHQAFHVFISDDGSHTRLDPAALELDQAATAKISLGFRPKTLGFSNNFLNSLACIKETFEYFAFSDQDDVWHDNKLERAIRNLSKVPSNVPALYCTRTVIVDESCKKILGTSPLFPKPPSFANALVQSIGGGNTMVFNKAARDLIVRASANVDVVSHDWWCYQIVSGAGGHVIYDPEPSLFYRQHGNNLVGSNNSWRARLVRIGGLFQGRFRRWNDINLDALSKNKALLTEENRVTLAGFIAARDASFFRRLTLLRRAGIYRQTVFGNMGLVMGVLIKKV